MSHAPTPHLADPVDLYARLTAMVQAFADRPALVHGDREIRYAELFDRVQQRRAQLAAAGVTRGHVVGLALPRGADAIELLLALRSLDAAYLPLDPAYPPERRLHMLRDAGAALVIAAAEHAGLFSEHAPVWTLGTNPPPAIPPAAPGTEPLAYIMFTSGSTGTPKGIAIRPAGIARLVLQPNYMALGPDTRMLHAAPLGFDASTLEIWGPLLNGGCCVIHDEDLPTPQGLARSIRTHRVDTAWLTAALFNSVIDADARALLGLKQLLTGGEALSVDHVRRAQAALPDTQIINGYGPTETTTFAATYPIPRPLPDGIVSVPIGRAINATTLHVLDASMQPVPAGEVGELFIGGAGVAAGYVNRPELTAERFLPDPFSTESGARLYRTGDLVRQVPDGNLDYVGRIDTQVKVRGFRIELAEIESRLREHPAVKSCAVIARRDAAGNTRLLAYAVAKDHPVPAAELRAHLAARLPEFMLPNAYTWLDALPLTVNGKLDQRALPEPSATRPDLSVPFQEPASDTERMLCAAFAEVLGIDRVGRLDNFFELGGNSLQVLRVLARLAPQGVHLDTTAFFRQPTPAALAQAAAGHDMAALDARRLSRARVAAACSDKAGHTDASKEPIAIIGMAARLPGADDVEAFWRLMLDEREGIRRFADDELDPSVPAELRRDPDYVKARGVIDRAEWFDAAFFGISPREAELMDPQQRVLLELCWSCLERAGYAPDHSTAPVGVFAGMYNPTYYLRHVQHRPDLVEALGEFVVMLGNEKDYVATRIAHRLNLTGPAVSVHTACSTSLVAVAQSVLALRAGQCDMALAGGAAITCPPNSGYRYEEGAMLSPDGSTRTFDAQAKGTVFSDGAAVVLLKRLSDALADGDTIHAVIRGVAVNNDGRDKASFTAPSVDGQAAVIEAALRDAGVHARSIGYVEAHGTATPLGDPVEVQALTRAYAQHTAERGFCRIGSAKSNIGHTVIAAGAAGLIKAALALSRERIPATLHFTAPNPKIDFAASPFVVNDRLTPWPRGAQPRRAAVSSFGVGGTNAHVIVEEAPALPAAAPAQGPQLLLLSARTENALQAQAQQLAEHLRAHPEVDLADVAHTLQVGRSAFAHRLAVVAETAEHAAQALLGSDGVLRTQRQVGSATPALVWLFPGQGAQYPGMGRGLYAADTDFRAALDAALAACAPHLPGDLRERLFSDAPDALTDTAWTQPATFCIEFALARMWQARGAEPVALIGHSVGEFAAAAIAGVMSLADAARLVARRGALMQAQPPGAMLSVRLPAAQVLPRLPAEVSLAADNAPGACVVAGPRDAIDALAAALAADGIAAKPLHTSHAFHSAMMDAVLAPFAAEVARVTLHPPRIPIVSTASGDWLRDQQATDPDYWVRHLRQPVRFSPAVQTALQRHAGAVLLEVGPRGTLCTLARQHGKGVIAIPTLADSPASESAQRLLAQGALWTAGIELPAPAAHPAAGRRRVELPTYPFERQRYWIDAPAAADAPAVAAVATCAVTPVPAAATLIAPAPTSSNGDATVLPFPLPFAAAAAAAPTAMPASAQALPQTAAAPRKPQLIEQLRAVFEDVSGGDVDAIDPARPFVELGIDSLTLTQAALQVKKQFGVPVSFRQLMENLRSFDLLASHLDAQLPPEPAADQPPAAAAAVNVMPPVDTGVPAMSQPIIQPATPNLAAAPAPAAFPAAPAGTVQWLIQQQMQLMAQQLALLSGQGLAAPVSAAATSIAAAPQPAAPTVPTPAAPAAPAAAPSTSPNAAQPDGEDAAPQRYDVKKAFGAIARIHTQSTALTPRQQARLQAFMRRYVERTAASRAYTEQHRPHLADPRVVNGFRPMTKEITYQLVMSRSKGAHLWDLDGNDYVDALNGFGMSLFGWQPDFVLEAVRAQLDAGYDIGPQHPLAGPVAELVCELTGFDRAGLCNTGSEAVMAAVRIARTVTGRSTVVLFAGSYHGTFDEVVVRPGKGGKGIPGAPGIMRGMFGDVRVLDYGTPESLEFIRANADDLAAVLVEPVQSRRPDFRPVDFLKEVRAITERSGTCLIFDEVITGFRSALGGAQALFGIRADLASYGKVIGGGMPIGVIAGKREFMDALDGGAWQYGDDSIPTVGVTYFAGTFVRHPLALAAAHASLLHLKAQGPSLQENLNARTTALADELSAFCREAGAPLEVRHFASLWRVTWLEDHPLQDLLFAMMRSRGVHILDNFPCFLTTAHSEADVRRIADAFKDSVRELQESEFLPRRAGHLSVAFDASKPPVPGARLGKDEHGKPAWFVPNPQAPGKYLKVGG